MRRDTTTLNQNRRGLDQDNMTRHTRNTHGRILPMHAQTGGNAQPQLPPTSNNTTIIKGGHQSNHKVIDMVRRSVSDGGATSLNHGIAPVLVILIMTRRSRLSINVLFLQSSNRHQTILLHSGTPPRTQLLKWFSVLAESMTISDPGLFNN